MIKRALMAGAFAGLLMLGGAGASSALPLAKPDTPSTDITKVGHGVRTSGAALVTAAAALAISAPAAA